MERLTDSGGSLSSAEAEYYADLDVEGCCDTGECERCYCPNEPFCDC